jgi:hypothetical protein
MNAKPEGVARPTISEVLLEFLGEQRQQLEPRIIDDYEAIVELFEDSLNGYAYQRLDREEDALFDELYDQGIEFCDVFGPNKILENVDEFLGDFMVRKVIAPQELLEAAGTMMKELAGWLREKGYATAEQAEMAIEEGAEAARSLPRAEELAGLLYDFARAQPREKIRKYAEGRFGIERVEPGKLWLSAWLSPGPDRVGPIAVPREITDLAEKGWVITLRLGRTRRGWRILDVGNVYPM